MPFGRRAAWGRVAFASAVVVSMVVLFAPAGDVPGAPPGVDKLVHGGVFLALAVTGRWAGVRTAALGPALVVYAGASEVLQGMAAMVRSAAVAAWIADAAGAFAGLLLWARLSRAEP